LRVSLDEVLVVTDEAEELADFSDVPGANPVLNVVDF